jgi:hypothetical protein
MLLPQPAQDCDPPTYSLPHRWDYRHAPPPLASYLVLMPQQHWVAALLVPLYILVRWNKFILVRWNKFFKALSID